MKKELAKTYDPKEFEDRLYRFWNESGYFQPSADRSAPTFSVVIPPILFEIPYFRMFRFFDPLGLATAIHGEPLNLLNTYIPFWILGGTCTGIKNGIFICLSGIATGASWLCYYRALQQGPASIIVPIDKLSIVVTVIFSSVFLREHLSPKAFFGLLAIVGGTMLLIL